MLQQRIVPGRGVFYAGESITVELSNIPDIPGRAVFRTNLPGVKQRRRELIEYHEQLAEIRDLDWFDIEMPGVSGRRRLTLPLTEIGCFEGKCCFIAEKDNRIFWAEGDNFHFKVTSASSVAGNTVYSAFVRQFGENLCKSHSGAIPDEAEQLDRKNFTVIPPSGTFRSLAAQLDHIFGTLNCNILQLLPIHPIPSSYGRMGSFGSPFAALDYFAVEPSLADFDPAVSPMEQFEELVDAVHLRQGRIFLDIPVNHTGWASKLQMEHPEYFCRDENGRFESPGAWGVVWADLCKLDYSRNEVAIMMAEVFLFWCRKGVDGFRCDAGYMVPEKAWDYIVAKVRSKFPETVFLLEGLGGPLEIQERLLRNSGLDWGYSEMFQNYSRAGIEYVMQVMKQSALYSGNLVSFAETHDNDRLAGSGHVFARLRFMVCALLSTGGAFGFANGAEFFAAEKIDVHRDSALNYGAAENLCQLAGTLNRLLKEHPAFTGNSKIVNVTANDGEAVAVLRSDSCGGSRVLVLLNLDCKNKNRAYIRENIPLAGKDLLSGKNILLCRDDEGICYDLAPGEGMAVAVEEFHAEDIATLQEVKLMEKKAFVAFYGLKDEKMPGVSFVDSPEAFVAELADSAVAPLTVWNGEQDTRRIIPVPAGDLLLVRNPYPFRCMIRESAGGFIRGVRLKDGFYGALLVLEKAPVSERRHLNLQIESFESGCCRRLHGVLCQLPEKHKFTARREYSGKAVRENEILVFGSNDSGSYAMFPAGFGSFPCKYHALLAVNNDPAVPDDRYCLFTGLHIYLAADGYSTRIDESTIDSFETCGENRFRWHFNVPAGQGRHMKLEAEFRFPISGDAVELEFFRPEDSGVPENIRVSLILRPELEDRINHHVTKAGNGAEWEFMGAVKDMPDGFVFAPGSRKLNVFTSGGSWHREPEWQYMCDLPSERYYGLEDKTDRFSPGYFYVPLKEKEGFKLSAWTKAPSECRWPCNEKTAMADPLINGMKRFVVKRKGLTSVIAGFPWFLDWGRDTLIALRGLVKAPEFQERCAMILRAFAGFEKNGTLPNVMHGNADANRDTSDAPLYLIIGVRDYIAETGDDRILGSDCGGRKLKDVIRSIVDSYISGTPNGIKMDPASGLIFSPAHFTWMDTNFPACTPREGYPVEIQALWYAVLKFTGMEELAEKVRHSVEKYYFPEHADGCSDCLHCIPGTPAAMAEADDHIRPNALLLITMGTVRDPQLCLKILKSSSQLLIPGAIRTLADKKVKYPLPVTYNGTLLNDPLYPYCGTYSGPENESRKKAYHNGTAWCWPFPGYCEALIYCGGASQKERALSLLSSGAEYLEKAVPGELSEVADGNAPHAPGGCPAQAWSITELFRVHEILQKL